MLWPPHKLNTDSLPVIPTHANRRRNCGSNAQSRSLGWRSVPVWGNYCLNLNNTTCSTYDALNWVLAEKRTDSNTTLQFTSTLQKCAIRIKSFVWSPYDRGVTKRRCRRRRRCRQRCRRQTPKFIAIASSFNWSETISVRDYYNSICST